MVKRIEYELFDDREFLIQLRRNWLGLIAVVEKKLGFKVTTKDKCDWWQQQFESTDAIFSHHLDWETDIT